MSRPPRLENLTYRGKHAYFLTFCTFRRRTTFTDAAIAAMVLDQFRRTARRFEFAVLAYCVMPDHVHLLVKGLAAAADLRRFAKSAKQSAGQRYACRAGETLWQEGYFDHVVRPEESLVSIARYVFENPVRARLVERPEDYPYVGSDTWSMAEVLNSAM